MNKKEFVEKYFVGEVWDDFTIPFVLASLDSLYLNFTKEQVIKLVSEFYDNADNIYNDLQDELKAKLEQAKEDLRIAIEGEDVPKA